MHPLDRLLVEENIEDIRKTYEELKKVLSEKHNLPQEDKEFLKEYKRRIIAQELFEDEDFMRFINTYSILTEYEECIQRQMKLETM